MSYVVEVYKSNYLFGIFGPFDSYTEGRLWAEKARKLDPSMKVEDPVELHDQDSYQEAVDD